MEQTIEKRLYPWFNFVVWQATSNLVRWRIFVVMHWQLLPCMGFCMASKQGMWLLEWLVYDDLFDGYVIDTEHDQWTWLKWQKGTMCCVLITIVAHYVTLCTNPLVIVGPSGSWKHFTVWSVLSTGITWCIRNHRYRMGEQRYVALGQNCLIIMNRNSPA